MTLEVARGTAAEGDRATEHGDDTLDERTRDILSGEYARRQLTPDRRRWFKARVAAKRQLGDDVPPRFLGEQLPQSEIMQRLAASSTWRTTDVQDTWIESLTGPRKGFTVRMTRYPDGAVAHLHFVHVIDELYRLVRWDVDDRGDRQRERRVDESEPAR